MVLDNYYNWKDRFSLKRDCKEIKMKKKKMLKKKIIGIQVSKCMPTNCQC